MDILESTYENVYNDTSTKKPEKFIEVVESNWKQIDEIETRTKEQLYFKTRLTSDYGITLSKVNRFEESLSIIEKATKMFENQINDPFKESLYEALIANRAYCNQQLKNISKAEKDFELLCRKFPDKSNYRDWLIGIKSTRLRKLDNLFLVLISIGIFFAIVFDENDGILNYGYLPFIVVGLLGTTYILIKKKRIKTLPNST